MAAILTVFTGSTIPGTLAGAMVFVETVMITGKSSSKGGNSHQGGYSKHSFHKVRV
jgi:cyanophycinase-like exopeptidase